MAEEKVEFKSNGGTANGYLYTPEGGSGPGPGRFRAGLDQGVVPAGGQISGTLDHPSGQCPDAILVVVESQASGELEKAAAGLFGAAAAVGTPIALELASPGAGSAEATSDAPRMRHALLEDRLVDLIIVVECDRVFLVRDCAGVVQVIVVGLMETIYLP